MPSIILEGNSLSVRHQKLNAAVNDAYKNRLQNENIVLSSEATDIDNIFKIDLASKYKNVDYIIENLKSIDGLCVARALKSTWLFTDKQYSHIINPIYVNTTLKSVLSDKTFKKLLYKITYHLNDEKRCEEFYTFYQQRSDICLIKKFLPKCSIPFIKEKIMRKDFDITPEYLSTLSFKSWEIVAAYVDMQEDKKIAAEYIYLLKHLLKVDGNFYLDLVENNIPITEFGRNFYLRKKATREVLRNYRSRIFAKPQSYLKMLDFDELTHILTINDIQNLAILVTSNNDFWDNYLLKRLLDKLPTANRYSFIQSVYEKYHPGKPFEMDSQFTRYRWYNYMSVKQKEEWALEHVARMDEDFGKVYGWYKFVNFKVTFLEIKKLLRAETEASSRENMFSILILTCSDEERDIFELLKYFHDRHINEVMHFKINIIENIIKSKKVYRCKNEVWNILNEIFLNMRIYESVNECNRFFLAEVAAQIVAHHVINDKPMAEKVLKFFDKYYTNLGMMVDTQWNEKVFDFLYTWNFQKIDGQDLKIAESLKYVECKTHELIGLTVRYGHEPRPELFSLIRKIRDHDPKFAPSRYYEEIFQEFFPTDPTIPELNEDVSMRLLKKDIKLLDSYKDQFDKDIINNTMRYRKFLTNIRIYFGTDFAHDWRKYLLSKFEGNHNDPKGCACVLFGLSILLPATEYEQFIQKYQPEKARLVWSEADSCLVHIQSNICKFMYLVRPTVNVDLLTSFAKGDFLQYTISSLMSISRQLPREGCNKLVMNLLAGRISVKKHGIRIAFAKYSELELLELFREMWSNTANVSMQKLILGNLHHLLTEANNNRMQLDIWKILKLILEQLHGNEYLINIITVEDSKKIGISVKPQYCMEYWHLLNTAPNINQIWAHRSNIVTEMAHEDLINLFDEEFLKEIMLHFLHNQFVQPMTENTKTPSYYINSVWSLITQFLVLCETADIAERRKNILKITLEHLFSNWLINDTQRTFHNVLKELLQNSQSVLHIDKKDIFNPIYIFEYMYTEMSKLFPKQDYYEHHLWLRLAIIFINSLYESRAFKPDSFEMQSRLWAEVFGIQIKQFMKVEINENYHLLPQLFRHYFFKFLDTELTTSHNREKFYNDICKSLLNEEVDIYSSTLAVECIVKVMSSRRISEADMLEAKSHIGTLKKMDIPYFNLFIDSRINRYSSVFR